HQKAKPAIHPSKLTEGERKPRGRRCVDPGDGPRRVDRTVIVPAPHPPGSRFKGYRDYTVQELVIRAETTLYRVETWLAREGRVVKDRVPFPFRAVGPGAHVGPRCGASC